MHQICINCKYYAKKRPDYERFRITEGRCYVAEKPTDVGELWGAKCSLFEPKQDKEVYDE